MTKKARILIVESDRDIRTMLELAFSYSGDSYHVSTAPSGSSALLQFGVVRPDIVLMDIDMPNDDGWQTLERIRELSTVPVIVTSGVDRSETRVRSLEAGADYCLTKPFGLREIHARVRALLRREQKADPLPPWSIDRGSSDGRGVPGSLSPAGSDSGLRLASLGGLSRPSLRLLVQHESSLSASALPLVNPITSH